MLVQDGDPNQDEEARKDAQRDQGVHVLEVRKAVFAGDATLQPHGFGAQIALVTSQLVNPSYY